jgi:hypothetical protein
VNRRYSAIVAGAALVLVGVVGLLAVPFSEKEPRPPEQSFEVGEDEAYRVVGNISVDDRVVLGVDGVVNESGASRVRIVESDVSSESYRGVDADVEYRQLVVDADQVERRLTTLEDDPDHTMVDFECGDGTGRIVTVTNATDRPDPTGAAAVVLTELRLAAYERVGSTDERGRRVLRPRSGWYESRRSYRLAGGSGQVTLSPGSNVVRSADVAWKRTTGTETYLHYLLLRDATIQKRIQYRYLPGEVDVERPAWVDDVAEGDGASGREADIEETSCP